MEAYLGDWLNLLARWLHVVAGIAWIGSSFYFIWLDNHLEAPPTQPRDGERISGELWSVHGGGFYQARKYDPAPRVLPETLHWFKWEAYWTWLSGMVLLILIYWTGAEVYLVDPNAAGLSPQVAVAIAAAFVMGGWFVYDLLCRLPLASNGTVFGVVLLALSSLLAWGLCQLFSGRAAYIHFGAVLGTIMVANVFFVIIPGQRRMVAAAERDEMPDAADGIRAKRRSVHNTWFTLPVLFTMTSHHFAMTYGHEYNWAILIAVSLAGVLIRLYFVGRQKGEGSIAAAVAALALIAAIAVLIAPRNADAVPQDTVSFGEVRVIVHHRCTGCHAAQPTFAGFPAPPGGVVLETDAQIEAEAWRIHQQTVVTQVMPIANLTGMSEEERAVLDRWYLQSGAGRDG